VILGAIRDSGSDFGSDFGTDIISKFGRNLYNNLIKPFRTVCPVSISSQTAAGQDYNAQCIYSNRDDYI
jgi:hypothetical protein